MHTNHPTVSNKVFGNTLKKNVSKKKRKVNCLGEKAG